MEKLTPNQSKSLFEMIRSETPPEHRTSIYHITSDSSFEMMENLCEIVDCGDAEHLLGDQQIPKFNDTLEEVEFLLSMGEKLKMKAIADKSRTENCEKIATTSTPISTSHKDSRLSVKKSVSGLLSPNFTTPTEITPKMRIKNQAHYLSPSSCHKPYSSSTGSGKRLSRSSSNSKSVL